MKKSIISGLTSYEPRAGSILMSTCIVRLPTALSSMV
jgi:hypothetical protein